MSSPITAADHAFVTLITSDSYLPGALAQAAALNDLHPTRRGGPFPTSTELEEEPNAVPFTTVCLVTPETVSVGTIKQLRRTFDLVVGVEVIEGDKDAEEIKLLGRPDLHQTFTKLHALRLAQFASIVFLDADVLPLRPLSHLLNTVSSWPDEYFNEGGDQTPTATAPGTSSTTIPTLSDTSSMKRNSHRLHNPEYPCPLSAAPDSGWPDIFNSGVIVLAPPGERGFKEAMGLRSWDGGDQGTLNEWVGRQGGLSTGQGSSGPGWNRLSFKYNVTPTAAYTYAPAYAKFGAAIHAVHFIGPSKPWASLPFRPAFISSNGQPVDKYVIGGYGSQSAPALAPETAYAYYSLVDRWFAVYDAHFRITEGGEPKSEFEVRKYESAWEGGKVVTSPGGAPVPAPDQQNQYPHVVPPHTYHVAVYSATAGFQPPTSYTASLEELRELALHGLGRADAPREGESAYISMPLEGRISLMRPPRPEPKPVERDHHHHEHHHHEPQHHEHHEHHQHHEHHRPPSPPRVHWNPAVEPPPHHFTGGSHGLPDNAFYHNQWDMPQGGQGQFFNPPPQTEYIPKELQDGQYSSLAANGYQPDAAQVKSIFPWEERNRPAPERTFPQSAPPPVQKVASPPERPASPPREFGIAYQNAWDDIPSIQRYASRLTGVKVISPGKPAVPEPPAAVPPPPQPQPEWSWERDRGQGGDASSREGDDEDDDSDSEETQTGGASVTGGTGANGGTNGTSRPKLGSRSGSRSGSTTKTSTSSPPKAAQSLKSTQDTSIPGNSANSQLKGFQSYLSERRNAQGALEGPMDLRTRLATLGSGVSTLIYPSGIEPQLPGFVQTPMSGARGDRASSPSMAEPSFEFSRAPPTSFSAATSLSVAGTLGGTLDILSHTQTISSDSEMANDSSPSSSTGSPSLESNALPPPPLRSWDEARSVDAFKRDSQEILARFLRMGSWEGDSEAPPASE